MSNQCRAGNNGVVGGTEFDPKRASAGIEIRNFVAPRGLRAKVRVTPQPIVNTATSNLRRRLTILTSSSFAISGGNLDTGGFSTVGTRPRLMLRRLRRIA